MSMTDVEAKRRAAEDGVIFLPDSFLRQRGLDPRAVAPSWLAPKHILLEGVQDIGDLSQVGGRAARPGNFTLVGRGPGRDPLMIVHDTETEAAEIEDLALEGLERKPIDFAEARERKGLPPKEQFDAMLRDAAQRYVKQVQAHSITMKPRDPMQQYVKGLVTVPALPFKTERS